MTPLKFKVYDPETNTIQPVGAIDWDTPCLDAITVNTPTIKLYKYYVHEQDFILLQYTGLNDKHNNEIYNGDKVKISFDTYGHIEFVDGMFCVKLDKPDPSDYAFIVPEITEVIGNIHIK